MGGFVAKILICEDDPLYRQIAEVAFAGSEHETEFLGDGFDVVHRLSKGGYHLLVTDIVMPDKDGLEVIREIRRRAIKVPILVMSGDSSSLRAPFLQAAKALGADEIIAKPFRPPALREKAEALMRLANDRLASRSA
jgi:DNA-binding response OmpR family regulator